MSTLNRTVPVGVAVIPAVGCAVAVNVNVSVVERGKMGLVPLVTDPEGLSSMAPPTGAPSRVNVTIPVGIGP